MMIDVDCIFSLAVFSSKLIFTVLC